MWVQISDGSIEYRVDAVEPFTWIVMVSLARITKLGWMWVLTDMRPMTANDDGPVQTTWPTLEAAKLAWEIMK